MTPPGCDQQLNFVNFRLGYRRFCRQNCNCMTLYANEARQATSMERYGTTSPMKLQANRDLAREAKLAYSPEQLQAIDQKRRETMLERYGVDNPNKSPEILARRVKSFKLNIEQWRESYQKTSNERYGTDHPWSSPEVRARYEQTMIERHGHLNPMQCDAIQAKAEQTNLARHGHQHTFQSDAIKAKIRETLLARWGCINPSHHPELKAKISSSIKKSRDAKLKLQHPEIAEIQDRQLLVNCESECKCGGQFTIDRYVFRQRKRFGIETCTEKKPVRASGYLEDSVIAYLDELGVAYTRKDRKVLGGQELDIFIPALGFAIEVNGVWWHNELYRDKGYHQQKTMAALDAGVELFHLWEDDWLHRQHIVKSMLASRLGKSQIRIGARKCQLMEVTPAESFRFLEHNHLQGGIRATVHLGLYYKDRLVAVACFGQHRRAMGAQAESGKWELYRFATVANMNISGGFSRLLKRFTVQWAPEEIMTYASMDHSTGGVYIKSGFRLESTTAPGYYWVVDGIRRHRWGFTKYKLVAEGADPELTEAEIMHTRGHYRVWDAGNLKFSLMPHFALHCADI